MAGELELAAQARAERRRMMISLPESLLGPAIKQIDRLGAARLLEKKIKEERNLRDAAIRVQTERAQRDKQDKEKKERAVAMAMAGQLSPEDALATGIPEAVEAALTVSSQKEVGGLPNIEAVRGFAPTNPYQAKAREKRLTELVDAGEMEREDAERKEKAVLEAKRQDTSKSITAASSLEELDRIDPGADATLGAATSRRRKVLREDEERRLGESLAGYKGEIEGLDAHFKEKGIKPTPRELASAQEIVFKRKSYEKVVKDMEAAEKSRTSGDPKTAASLYSSAQTALNSQIDDIMKNALKRDLVTGSETFDESLLTPQDRTLLVRLKTDRLKVTDALTGLATADPTSLLRGMTPEQKAALGEALLKELGGK